MLRMATGWMVGGMLMLGASAASASLNFEVVGDVLWDRDTGYAWRRVVHAGYPATLDLGGGWQYASRNAFRDMLPGFGSYAAGSGVSRAVAYFDPTSRGYVGGWVTHGTRGGYPLFDTHGYYYTLGSGGSVNITGLAPGTIGDYNAGYCIDPNGPLAPLCDRPNSFLIVNTEWPGAVPLPAGGLLLASGLALGVGVLRRRPRA